MCIFPPASVSERSTLAQSPLWRLDPRAATNVHCKRPASVFHPPAGPYFAAQARDSKSPQMTTCSFDALKLNRMSCLCRLKHRAAAASIRLLGTTPSLSQPQQRSMKLKHLGRLHFWTSRNHAQARLEGAVNSNCNGAAEGAYTLISSGLSSQDLQPGGILLFLVELTSPQNSIL